ncbi:excalibur calcium-binding domain-containing protein [Oleiagrimonas sp. C23AA]|nr:excalibur calcium-binding domain-containing protein [Oleiagrimonas sp. C23AA]
MSRVWILLMAGLSFLAIYLLTHHRSRHVQSPGPRPDNQAALASPHPLDRHFSCDGRKYCSQMRSRAEAEFFNRNCPGTRMDGDHDGVPCENDSRF